MDFIISIFSAVMAEYRLRRLAKLADVNVKGEKISPKMLLQALKDAEAQMKLRQAYGLLSGGGKCVVKKKDGRFEVRPM